MDSSSPVSTPVTSGAPSNTVLIVIGVIIILILLGVNVIFFTQNIFTYIWNFITETLGVLGYSVGSGIEVVADATEITAKTSIDIIGDAVGDVGKLLKQGSANQRDTAIKNIDGTINSAKHVFTPNEPTPTPGDSPVQNSISSNKSQWCLVGEDKGARNCVSVDKDDKCMSGQLFPEKAMCLNPTLSKNEVPK